MIAAKKTSLFSEFFESEKTGGILLILATAVSLLLANSPWGESYTHFWHRTADWSWGQIHLKLSVEEWINDGLMAIFFLMVGLEIERELYIGELADFKKALLPVLAAIGGMALPAGFHFYFNHGQPTQSGIGIPMATDIAFALGILSLLGNRVPLSLKIFLSAVAIIDDLGAVIIIALFYTKSISFLYLSASLVIFLCLLLMNKLKVQGLLYYILPGIIMWYCMLQSGVHATISGILLAFSIPFSRQEGKNPSEKLQHTLHKPVAFLILPLFAMANTGILLSGNLLHQLTNSNSLGILLGLAAGKPIGILLVCLLAISLKVCRMPDGMNWNHLCGLGILAGIGFTMSIFISNMAFSDPGLIGASKIAVLAASLFCSLLGLLVLQRSGRQPGRS